LRVAFKNFHSIHKSSPNLRFHFILDSDAPDFYASVMSSTLTISLPAPVKKWVEQQALKQGYKTPNAFLLNMVRRERAQAAIDHVDAILIEAINSGKPTPLTKDTWASIRRKGLKLAQARRRK
jgi:hypothetical protein